MDSHITLNWHEFARTDKFNPFNKDHGIYLWGFTINEFIPYYVGMAKNKYVHRRLMDHLNYLLGGMYTIYHINYMVETCTFTYAKADGDFPELEKLCINQIVTDFLANSQAGVVNNLSVKHTGCTTVLNILN